MIEVSDLKYTYPGASKLALTGLEFTIQRGEVFGFLGPSGAGKSTTQKILIGLLRGYEGQITVLGRELSAWGSDFYDHIGVSFELPNHYLKLTGLENLNYFRSLYAGETDDPLKLLEMVGLGDAADVRVAQYSKGMKMRLNFARSLLNKPRLLFLDEPTSGLDPVNARMIKDIVQGMQAEGTTVFLTTHDMSVADELCDRVAFIVDGEIKLIDAPKTLKVQHGQRKVAIEFGVNGHIECREFPLDGLADNAEFITLLRDNHIETIHTRETTLENIFIRVTGRELQ